MDDIRFTFKDLHEGDEIIVTDVVVSCNYYKVISIAKGDMGWHFVLELRNGISTKYVDFWVNDLECTHIYLDDGRVAYVNAIDFLDDRKNIMPKV